MSLKPPPDWITGYHFILDGATRACGVVTLQHIMQFPKSSYQYVTGLQEHDTLQRIEQDSPSLKQAKPATKWELRNFA